MNDKMIQVQGGLYTPDELASAYAERGDRIEELSRDNRRREGRLAELEAVAEAVMTLVNFAVKGEDFAHLHSDLDDLRSDIEELRSDDKRIDSDLDAVVRILRDAAAKLASV